MHVTIFGATGALGRECLKQCLEAGHQVTVLARTPSKIPRELRAQLTVVEGDGLNADDVNQAIGEQTEAVLFAIGIDRHSPEDLCTDVTRHILAVMSRRDALRLVWCGGGSTLVEEDRVSSGARFVEWFTATFMGLRHRDKLHQLELLGRHMDVQWLGIRPLQMRTGGKRGVYRLGFDSYSGLSKISFADCADAMIGMINDDTWLHKAPIVQY